MFIDKKSIIAGKEMIRVLSSSNPTPPTLWVTKKLQCIKIEYTIIKENVRTSSNFVVRNW